LNLVDITFYLNDYVHPAIFFSPLPPKNQISAITCPFGFFLTQKLFFGADFNDVLTVSRTQQHRNSLKL
jgi:hypothetical protein